MGSAVAEIKKLSEQLSQMRQENIALKVGTIIFGVTYYNRRIRRLLHLFQCCSVDTNS